MCQYKCAKTVKKTKIDGRNVTGKRDNRARRNKNNVNRKEKKDRRLEKIDLKKISQLLDEEQSRSDDRNKSTPPVNSTNSSITK